MGLEDVPIISAQLHIGVLLFTITLLFSLCCALALLCIAVFRELHVGWRPPWSQRFASLLLLGFSLISIAFLTPKLKNTLSSLATPVSTPDYLTSYALFSPSPRLG